MTFDEFFSRTAGSRAGALIVAHAWQSALASDATFRDRLIRIPTGMGKTLGVMAAWLWHRMERGDPAWPRRLVWCLPMRVLVEQTEAEIRASLGRLGLLRDGKTDHAGKVGVHVLMGGSDEGDWRSYPKSRRPRAPAMPQPHDTIRPTLPAPGPRSARPSSAAAGHVTFPCG